MYVDFLLMAHGLVAILAIIGAMTLLFAISKLLAWLT